MPLLDFMNDQNAMRRSYLRLNLHIKGQNKHQR